MIPKFASDSASRVGELRNRTTSLQDDSLIHAVTYIATLIAMAAIDAVWLTSTSNILYRSTLGDIMLANVKVGPAVAFYLLYPIGLTVFAVEPAFKSGSIGPALAYGALFGLIAYAAYDLTNYATLRNWTLMLTVLDMTWGTIVSALASAVAFYVVKATLGLPS